MSSFQKPFITQLLEEGRGCCPDLRSGWRKTDAGGSAEQ